MLDITASKTYYYDEYIGYDTKDEVAGFTLSSKLNDYEDTYRKMCEKPTPLGEGWIALVR